MSVITVTSAAGLTSALKVAQGGDTIQLASGTYSGVVITGANFASQVTITSADPSKLAVISGLNIGNSSGLVFSNMELTTVGAKDIYYAFRMTGVTNVDFRNMDIHGDPTKAPTDQVNGFYVNKSSDIEFTGSKIHDLDNGLLFANSDHVLFDNNVVTKMDKGGLQFGATSDVKITHNTFTDFVLGAGTHSDAVQFTTSGTTVASKNITITDNIMSRGTGDAYQGVFIQDETRVLPFENVVVSNNVISGGMWNGIYVNGAVKGVLDVSYNNVTSWTGVDKAGTGDTLASTATTFGTKDFLASIILKGDFSSATLTETGNLAQGYTINAAIVPPLGNIQVGTLSAPTAAADASVTLVTPPAIGHVLEHAIATGNVLTGATGGNVYLADVGVGALAQKVIDPTAGLTLVGKYGTLSVATDGSYKYVETKDGLVAGQSYVDHFTTTIANSSGQAATSTFDVTVTGTSIGDGGKNLIIASDAGSVLSGFGAGSDIRGGAGADKFQFDSLSQTNIELKLMQNNDVIDLSHLAGDYHMVSNFTGHANEVMLRHIGVGQYMVYGDANGDKIQDLAIHITQSSDTLTLGNFIL